MKKRIYHAETSFSQPYDNWVPLDGYALALCHQRRKELGDLPRDADYYRELAVEASQMRDAKEIMKRIMKDK